MIFCFMMQIIYFYDLCRSIMKRWFFKLLLRVNDASKVQKINNTAQKLLRAPDYPDNRPKATRHRNIGWLLPGKSTLPRIAEKPIALL